MIAVPVEIMPKPELTKAQSRFFRVVNTKNTIGFWFISVGSFFLLGYLVSDKAHWHDKAVLGIGFILVLFGAHFLSSAPTEAALLASGRFLGKVMPSGRRGDTAEQKASGGGEG